MPRTIRASAIRERWQRQGTASAHINNLSNRMEIQQLEENLERPRGMTHRQDNGPDIRYWFLFQIRHHADLYLRQGCLRIGSRLIFIGSWVGP